jgi:hypothetical protein
MRTANPSSGGRMMKSPAFTRSGHGARSAATGLGTGQRDPEDVRHGPVSLLAGLDLATRDMLGWVRPRHRSAEFVELLPALDQNDPPGVKIHNILGNPSAHTARETRAY